MARGPGSITDDVLQEVSLMYLCCPYCGERSGAEFAYGGDASAPRPGNPASLSDAEWYAWLYERDNPVGRHQEYWYHQLGCRQWLVVVRDTVSNDIIAVEEPVGSGGGQP